MLRRGFQFFVEPKILWTSRARGISGKSRFETDEMYRSFASLRRVRTAVSLGFDSVNRDSTEG